ncbi:NAD(P)/FAD-dependent oxidoreductase [Taklimakanibacter lacteus]|uniref:NAD(P)/FAD-dependent oxidoreductase n=1 Tax=Taklimakanibacter lacteus TaxID=2268456 RepID=UPI000E66AF39
MKVAIVGGGIAGLSSAWALTKRGHDVTLIEQGELPNLLSASGDEHRMIRRGYGSADGYARTISEAFEAWEEMWGDLGRSHLAARGVLAMSQIAGDDGEKFREGYDRMGEAYELYEPKDAARRYPFIDPGTIRYAYHTKAGGALLCQRIARDLARWLQEKGAVLRLNSGVTAIDEQAGGVTLADGARITADQIIIAAGAWVLRLVPELAESLRLYRTAVAYLAPPADLAAAWAEAPAILDIGGKAEAYMLPPVDGTGLKVGAGVHKRPASAPDANRSPIPGEGESLRKLLSPPLARIDDYRVSRVVTCAYTFTADEKFLSYRKGKALVVSACSGHGYKFGAAIGRRVATALETGNDPALLAWLRAEA